MWIRDQVCSTGFELLVFASIVLIIALIILVKDLYSNHSLTVVGAIIYKNAFLGINCEDRELPTVYLQPQVIAFNAFKRTVQ